MMNDEPMSEKDRLPIGALLPQPPNLHNEMKLGKASAKAPKSPDLARSEDWIRVYKRQFYIKTIT
jgi:hypothetical protein